MFWIFFLFFFSFINHLSHGADTISANQSLSGDQTITSAGGNFKLGFYKPGAVMYLFRGEFGCMLYTGDFRWETTSKRAEIGKSMLLSALGNDKVDILYLDNTYCNPSYSFPSREVIAQQFSLFDMTVTNCSLCRSSVASVEAIIEGKEVSMGICDPSNG
ncbi:5' exonuclease Apollo [Camellia lanceoleosa]|nr:5' exonuclease Apollo [Camellia lanceoleosa]